MGDFNIPRIGDDTVKDKIIELLIREPGLTLRELCSRISKNSSVTYQAVHKSLGELISKDIIMKEDMQYRLNKSWIDKLRNFVDNVSCDEKEIIQKLHKQGIIKLSFNSQIGFGKFLLPFVLEFHQENKDEMVVINSWHIYNMWWLSESDLYKFKSWKDLKLHVLSDSETEVDRWLARIWEGIGAKIAYGADNCRSSDYIVVGDYVIDIRWNKKVRDEWEKQRGSLGLHEYNVLKGIQHIVADDKPMQVIISKDQLLAAEIRQRTLERFK